MTTPFNTTDDYKTQIAAAKRFLAGHKQQVIEQRQILKGLLAARKTLIAERKAERAIAKIVKADAKAVKAAAREAKRADRIAKMEARLTKLKMASGRKHGKPVVYTAEQIAALNAA